MCRRAMCRRAKTGRGQGSHQDCYAIPGDDGRHPEGRGASSSAATRRPKILSAVSCATDGSGRELGFEIADNVLAPEAQLLS
jgi:hypothetical protein